MTDGQTTNEQTDISFPGFLRLLDSDPKRVAEDFYCWVTGLFRTAPPRILRSVPADRHSDLIHDIVVHCIKDNFRVLRQYSDRGKPFAVWFYLISRRLILDWIDHENIGPELIDPLAQPTEADGVVSESSGSNPGVDAQLREMLEAVNGCLDRIGDYCKALLRMAGDEWLPREMVQALGLQKDKAKKVSNDLGYCRKKLENLLVEYGMDIEDLRRCGEKL